MMGPVGASCGELQCLTDELGSMSMDQFFVKLRPRSSVSLYPVVACLVFRHLVIGCARQT